ncbi:phage major capsid protein [Petrachloros mirabilis]
MNIQEMLAERKRLLDEAKAIQAKADSENRPLTEEEETDIKTKLSEAKTIEKQIEEARETQQRQARLKAELEAADNWEGQPQPRQTQQVQPTSTNVRITGGEASGKFSHFGEYLFKVRDAALMPSTTDPRLHPVAAAPRQRTDIDSAGGFLIPDEYSSTILDKMYNTGELLSRVKAAGMYFPIQRNTLKVPMVDETSRATGSRSGGVRGYWVEEAGSITDSPAKFGQLTLTLHKAGALGYVTDEMLEDIPAAGAFLERLFVRELIFTVENAIVNGSGSNKPLGILNADCAVSASAVTNQTSATVWGPNITSMWARMWAPARMTAVWLVEQSVEPYLFGLALEGRYGSESTSADAIPIYFPAGTAMNTGSYARLMGRDVIPTEYCQAVGTLGDIILWDPASYIIVDKAAGPQFASSIHVQFLTDQTTFRVTYRVDGQPTWSSALTPFSAGNTLSPIVLLTAR